MSGGQAPDPWMDEGPYPGPDVEDEGEDAKPGRSTIRFPYADLKQALRVPTLIKDQYGSACEIDQLAGAFKQTPRSGAFRTRIAAAVSFGLVTSRKNRVALTQLGHQAAAGSEKALVDAFLSVELYKRLYDQYRGVTLPADPGLTAEIRNLGVLDTQADRARQIMQRSAETAGFFRAGKDRLVVPPLGTVGGGETPPAKPPLDPSGGGQNMAENPLLQGLWSMLPSGSEFPAEKREQWFKALAVNLDLVYASGDEVVVVEVKRHRKNAAMQSGSRLGGEGTLSAGQPSE